MSRTVHSMTFPSATRCLAEVRRFVTEQARAAGFTEAERGRLKLAVDEACTNIIEHAYQHDTTRQIDLAVIAETDRLIVRLRDEGKAFDPSTYRAPDPPGPTGKAGGLGVHLMRQLMDDVAYERRGRVNEVRLTMQRARQMKS